MKKNQQLLWDLYVGVVRDAKKNQRLLWKLYAGIARNVKKPNEYHGPICEYCNE
jgi:hypothetical protein